MGCRAAYSPDRSGESVQASLARFLATRVRMVVRAALPLLFAPYAAGKRLQHRVMLRADENGLTEIFTTGAEGMNVMKGKLALALSTK